MAESSNYAKQNRVFERVIVAFQRGLIQPTPEPCFDAPGIEQLAVAILIGQNAALPGLKTIHIQSSLSIQLTRMV